MSCSICQPLANNAAERASGALYIINTKRNPLVVSEIKLRKIPLQMFLADVMIDTVNSALQDREISFDGVGVRIAAHVFLGGMVHGLVASEALADLSVYGALVGTQINFGEICSLIIGFMLVALTFGTWKDATWPLRSTSATTGSWRGNFSA